MPIRSVSNATMSPFSMTRAEHSWYHGFVRGPDVRSRVSNHSPPDAMFAAVHHRPQLLLGSAGLHRCCHLGNAGLTRRHREPDRVDLEVGLDGLGEVGDRLPVDHLDAEAVKRSGTVGVEAVDCEPERPAPNSSAISAAHFCANSSVRGPVTKWYQLVASRTSLTAGWPTARCSQPLKSNNTTGPSTGTNAYRHGLWSE